MAMDGNGKSAVNGDLQWERQQEMVQCPLPCLTTGGQVTNFYDFGSPSCNDGFLELTNFPGNNQRLRQIIASPSASCWLQSS